jgi:hypothetical protein
MIPNPGIEGSTTGYAATTSVNRDLATEWSTSGTSSIKLTPTGVSVDSFSHIGGDTGGFRLGMQAGKTYSISGDVYTPNTQVGPLHGTNARKIAVFYKDVDTTYKSFLSTQGPAVGTARVSLTFTIPAGATEAFVRLYNGSSNTNDIVYWDSILLEESPSVGEYFDGNSLDTLTYTTKWTGVKNNSTSELYRIENAEGYTIANGIADAKRQTFENVLGPSPTLDRSFGSFTDVKQAALEKVLSDNGLI